MIPAPSKWDKAPKTAKLPKALPTRAVKPSIPLQPEPAAPPPSAPGVSSPLPDAPARVLIAHSDPALLRLLRESLETFLHCEVRTTSSGLAAFDRTLEEPYRLLLLDLHLPDLPGELLYDLITRTYQRVHPGSHTAPAVMWLGLAADHPRQDELTREARTKALLLMPLKIQRLLDTAATLLPQRSIPNA